MLRHLLVFVVILMPKPILADWQDEMEMIELAREQGEQLGEAMSGYRSTMQTLISLIDAQEKALAKCGNCAERKSLLKELARLYYQRDLGLAIGSSRAAPIFELISADKNKGREIPQSCRGQFNGWSDCLGDEQLTRAAEWLSAKDGSIVSGQRDAINACVPKYFVYRQCVADDLFRKETLAERFRFESKYPIDPPALLVEKQRMFGPTDGACDNCLKTKKAHILECTYGPLDTRHNKFGVVRFWHGSVPIDINALRSDLNNPLLKYGDNALDSCPQKYSDATKMSRMQFVFEQGASSEIGYRLASLRAERAAHTGGAIEDEVFEKAVKMICADEFGQERWRHCTDRLWPKYRDKRKGIQKTFEVACPEVDDEAHRYYHDSCISECAGHYQEEDRHTCEKHYKLAYWSNYLTSGCDAITRKVLAANKNDRILAHNYSNVCRSIGGPEGINTALLDRQCTQTGPLKLRLEGKFIATEVPCQEGIIRFKCDPTVAKVMKGALFVRATPEICH